MTTGDIETFSESDLEKLYRWPENTSLRLNLVLDKPGSIKGSDGTSKTLTNPEDRKLLRAIRSQAEIIVQGAETIRQEGWFLPPQGRLFVLSASEDLPWDTCPDTQRVSVFSNVSALVHNFASQHSRVLCEGGWKTSELLAEHYGFDEIALSYRNSEIVRDIPPSLSRGQKYELHSQLNSSTYQMAFGLWRRAT